MQKKRLLGIGLAMFGACLWGVSGPASELLFAQGVDVAWLISSKMLIAGVLTMLLALVKAPQAVLAPWRNRRDAGQMVIFILFGMITMQFIYFKAVAVGNAPTATILQYLAPVVILVLSAFMARTLPRRQDVLIIALAMFGTLMVVTKGHLTQLAIGPQALFWGLLAALAAAMYTMLPAGLLRRHSPLVVTAWAQLLGGLVMTAYRPVWQNPPHLDRTGIAAYAFVVLFGTLVAYLVYLASLQYISATAASLLDAFEPLGATVVSVLMFHLHLGGPELLGGALIIATVCLMAVAGPKAPKVKPAVATAPEIKKSRRRPA
ncbi:DMT family transporter [Lacticaseibacillus suibinensis]|uniref:DMT family transporter n=1 Tax=Lacticaseibacillus suibinensis TaxID=2486011 RepID=UPI000F7AC52B|nr:DMT family transporter [Lacticaseibacillus suibinensis]